MKTPAARTSHATSITKIDVDRNVGAAMNAWSLGVRASALPSSVVVSSLFLTSVLRGESSPP